MNNNWRFTPACCVILLTGCSGGGGDAAPVASPTASVVSQTAQPAPANSLVLNFQAAGTTITYQPASATIILPGGTGGVASASGQGATLVVTNDGGGNVAGIVLQSPSTAGSTVIAQVQRPPNAGQTSAAPSGATYLPTPTLSQVSSFLYGTFGIPESPPSIYGGTTAFDLSQWAAGKNLSSSAYGIWGASDMTGLAGPAGTFAFGNLSPAASVPATGSATFNGTTIGAGAGNAVIYALQGDAQITANFATQSVTASLTNLKTENILTKASASLPDLSGTSAISGNAYAGTIAGGGLNGTINGNFYGSAAQETAGVWQASGGGNAWIGSFGAK